MTVGTLALIMENKLNLYWLWLLSGLSQGEQYLSLIKWDEFYRFV